MANQIIQNLFPKLPVFIAQIFHFQQASAYLLNLVSFPFTLTGAAKERMLSRQLTEIGMDWVRAVIGRAGEAGDSLPAREVVDFLEDPVCKNIHPAFHIIFAMMSLVMIKI